jgi:hypothetical protein
VAAGVTFDNYISMISFDKSITGDADRPTDAIISIVDSILGEVNAKCRENGLHATRVCLTGHEDDGQSMTVRFSIEVGPVGHSAVSRRDITELARIVVGVNEPAK